MRRRLKDMEGNLIQTVRSGSRFQMKIYIQILKFYKIILVTKLKKVLKETKEVKIKKTSNSHWQIIQTKGLLV